MSFTDIPFVLNYAAQSGPFGTLIKPGGRVAAYVRSTGLQEGDDLFANSGNLVASINEGLKRCRSGFNDIVYVLPGHVESLAGADAWPDIKAGAQIVSAGRPGASNNPTLTWTATASQLLVDVANVSIIGFNMSWIGIDAVVLAVSVTAAGCLLAENVITLESATAGVLKGIELAVGANGFRFKSNTFLSLGEAKPLTSAVILISGACNDVEIDDSYFSAANPGTSVLGHVALTAAATNVRIRRNTFIQLETAGTALFVVTVGDVAATGEATDNRCKIGSAVTTTTSGFTVGTAGLVGFGLFDNKCADTALASGVLSPVVSS